MVLTLFIGLIPVLLLLAVLLLLDSLKLVRKSLLLACLGWGVISAICAFFLNTGLLSVLRIPVDPYSCYIAPPVEEGLKALLLLVMIWRGRVGFIIDGAIYGFAVGSAFAFSENLFFLLSDAPQAAGLTVWITRGFGTAVMHGGTMAIFAILCMGGVSKRKGIVVSALPAYATAVTIHAIYNQFLISPGLSVLIIILLVPGILILSFRLHESKLRSWMELEFDAEVRLLAQLRMGHFSETRAGAYLKSLNRHFPAEVVVDLYCYVQLYLELSLVAKRNMMLREQDLVVARDPATAAKLTELRALERSIGPAGVMALSPLFRMGRKELWKLSMV